MVKGRLDECKVASMSMASGCLGLLCSSATLLCGVKKVLRFGQKKSLQHRPLRTGKMADEGGMSPIDTALTYRRRMQTSGPFCAVCTERDGRGSCTFTGLEASSGAASEAT